MTEPSTQPEPPPAAVVEFGSARPGRLDRVVHGPAAPGGARRVAWRHPMLPWSLGVLGAVAMFGSLIGEWQQVHAPFSEEIVDEAAVGIGLLFIWGPVWVICALLLAVCGGLALAGQPQLRPYARSVGLAVAVADLGVLVAAGRSLLQESLLSPASPSVDLALGRGAYAAFASVLLIGAALYLAGFTTPRPAAPRQDPAADGGGPVDLVVAPAEPLITPSDHHR